MSRFLKAVAMLVIAFIISGLTAYVLVRVMIWNDLLKLSKQGDCKPARDNPNFNTKEIRV